MLQEKQDYLEVVREVWGMQLDATRNRIIRIDLIVAIASFALIMPTVPAAFFGMNLRSGMEVGLLFIFAPPSSFKTLVWRTQEGAQGSTAAPPFHSDYLERPLM